MYNCEMCGETTEPGQSIIRHTVKTRVKNYAARDYKGKRRKPSEEDPDSEPGSKMVFDPGGVGSEIVKEVKVCSNCGVKLSLGGYTFEPFKAPFRGPLTPRKRAPAPVPIPEEIRTYQLGSFNLL